MIKTNAFIIIKNIQNRDRDRFSAIVRTLLVMSAVQSEDQDSSSCSNSISSFLLLYNLGNKI